MKQLNSFICEKLYNESQTYNQYDDEELYNWICDNYVGVGNPKINIKNGVITGQELILRNIDELHPSIKQVDTMYFGIEKSSLNSLNNIIINSDEIEFNKCENLTELDATLNCDTLLLSNLDKMTKLNINGDVKDVLTLERLRNISVLENCPTNITELVLIGMSKLNKVNCDFRNLDRLHIENCIYINDFIGMFADNCKNVEIVDCNFDDLSKLPRHCTDITLNNIDITDLSGCPDKVLSLKLVDCNEFTSAEGIPATCKYFVYDGDYNYVDFSMVPKTCHIEKL